MELEDDNEIQEEHDILPISGDTESIIENG